MHFSRTLRHDAGYYGSKVIEIHFLKIRGSVFTDPWFRLDRIFTIPHLPDLALNISIPL